MGRAGRRGHGKTNHFTLSRAKSHLRFTPAQTETDNELPLPPWASDVEVEGRVHDAAATATPEDDDDAAAAAAVPPPPLPPPPPPPPGIVLRTDYSAGSEDAWAAFCGALREAEREFLADQEGSASSASAVPAAPDDGDDDDDDDVEMAHVHVPPTGSTKITEEEEKSEGDGDGDGDGDEEEPVLFSLFSDPARFNHISNLRALRLLFDVSVRTAPAAPSSPSHDTPARHRQRQQQQQQQQHRLMCLRGLQEMYDTHGRTLWIFDSRSRTDGCARLVSEAGDVATLVPVSPPSPSDAY